MSRRVDLDARIRELARQHPGWTPSQMAIFLQGEGLKVTSEDVRRTLARPVQVAAATPEGGDHAVPPQYAAPREVPRRSALPVGLLFGILLFAYYVGIQVLPVSNPGLLRLALLLGTGLLLLMSGSVASYRYASGARAGLTAAVVNILLSTALFLAVYSQLQPRFAQVTGRALPSLSDSSTWTGLAFGFATLLLIFGLIGTLLGWLGAILFGRKERRPTFG